MAPKIPANAYFGSSFTLRSTKSMYRSFASMAMANTNAMSIARNASLTIRCERYSPPLGSPDSSGSRSEYGSDLSDA